MPHFLESSLFYMFCSSANACMSCIGELSMGLREMAVRQKMRRGSGHFVEAWEMKTREDLRKLEQAVIEFETEPCDYTLDHKNTLYIACCQDHGRIVADLTVAHATKVARNRLQAQVS